MTTKLPVTLDMSQHFGQAFTFQPKMTVTAGVYNLAAYFRDDQHPEHILPGDVSIQLPPHRAHTHIVGVPAQEWDAALIDLIKQQWPHLEKLALRDRARSLCFHNLAVRTLTMLARHPHIFGTFEDPVVDRIFPHYHPIGEPLPAEEANKDDDAEFVVTEEGDEDDEEEDVAETKRKRKKRSSSFTTRKTPRLSRSRTWFKTDVRLTSKTEISSALKQHLSGNCLIPFHMLYFFWFLAHVKHTIPVRAALIQRDLIQELIHKMKEQVINSEYVSGTPELMVTDMMPPDLVALTIVPIKLDHLLTILTAWQQDAWLRTHLESKQELDAIARLTLQMAQRMIATSGAGEGAQDFLAKADLDAVKLMAQDEEPMVRLTGATRVNTKKLGRPPKSSTTTTTTKKRKRAIATSSDTELFDSDYSSNSNSSYSAAVSSSDAMSMSSASNDSYAIPEAKRTKALQDHCLAIEADNSIDLDFVQSLLQ